MLVEAVEAVATMAKDRDQAVDLGTVPEEAQGLVSSKLWSTLVIQKVRDQS